jgi:8-amino-7-oxononanoate synthase
VRWVEEALEQLRSESQLRVPTTLAWETATRAIVAGRRVEVFCGNDYLGLRRDPRIAAAAIDVMQRDGTGAGASRLVAGSLAVHEHLERSLSDWLRQPAALLVSSGFSANVGCIPALAGDGDVLFSDALNHASIIDGCRLSRARTVIVSHRDTDALEREVRRQRPFRRGFVVTESLFSMDGDVADLAKLRAFCDREALHLYVDEAHAVGVFGPSGGGALAEAAVAGDIVVATLGKALGSAGAAILGGAALRTYLWNRCRSFVYSTGLPPAVASAAQKAVAVVRADDRLRSSLAANTERLRTGLGRAGLPALGDSRSPIVPLLLGASARALAASAALLERGFYVQAIRPPTVPRDTARLRVTVSAAHSFEAIDALVDALRAIA